MIAYDGFALPETVPKADCTPHAVSRWPRSIARTCGTGVSLMGLVVLLGWLLGCGEVKSVLPGLAEMKANTALCFLLSGAALWAIARIAHQG